MASQTPAGPKVSAAAPGWDRHPACLYDARWWTGLAWSAYVRAGAVTSYAPLPSQMPDGQGDQEATDELGHLEYLEHFLDQARAARAINATVYHILKNRMAIRRQPV